MKYSAGLMFQPLLSGQNIYRKDQPNRESDHTTCQRAGSPYDLIDKRATAGFDPFLHLAFQSKPVDIDLFKKLTERCTCQSGVVFHLCQLLQSPAGDLNNELDRLYHFWYNQNCDTDENPEHQKKRKPDRERAGSMLQSGLCAQISLKKAHRYIEDQSEHDANQQRFCQVEQLKNHRRNTAYMAKAQINQNAAGKQAEQPFGDSTPFFRTVKHKHFLLFIYLKLG